MKRDRTRTLRDLNWAMELLSKAYGGSQPERLPVRCDIVHSLLHQLEQPEPDTNLPNEDTQLDGQEGAVALHTVHLDELTEQLAELTKLVHEHHSMTDCSLNTHWAELNDLQKRVGGPPTLEASPAPAACDHPPNRVLHWTVEGQSGNSVSWCGRCGDMRYYAGKWSSPEIAIVPAPPEPACEHPKTRVLIRDRLDAVAVTECESCKDVCVRGTWYSQHPSSETPPASAEPACEHPNNAQSGITAIDVVMCCKCHGLRRSGGATWYTPVPANEANEAGDGDEVDEDGA